MDELPRTAFTIPVTVQIPQAIYKRLAVAGQHHGATVAELASEVIRRALASGGHRGGADRASRRDKGKPRRLWGDEDTKALIARNAEGVSDYAIAKELGWSDPTVHDHRVALGLPTNYRGRRRLEQEA
jgi:hypothetical protein